MSSTNTLETAAAAKKSHSTVSNSTFTGSPKSKQLTANTSSNGNNTLQPKKSSSSPLSKIKFHSISKRRFSGQKLNLNEKYQLINKKHCTSSSSFIGSDDYDYINYGAAETKSSSGGKSSLKKYFMKFASGGDRTSNSNSDALEERNLFHLKRPHHYNPQNKAAGKSTTSDDNEFDVLNF